MIVSHKHKFIFIKTRKTAGTSVEMALSKICGDDDIITPFNHVDEKMRQGYGGRTPQNLKIPFSKYNFKDLLRLIWYRKRIIFKNHMPAVIVKRYVSKEVWENYYKFCFERHPVTKLKSHFQFRSQRVNYASFEDYIQSPDVERIRGIHFYKDAKGNLLIDKVYKMEEMNDAFADISKKLNLQKCVLNVPDFKLNKSSEVKKLTADFINNKYGSLIKKLFKTELEEVYKDIDYNKV